MTKASGLYPLAKNHLLARHAEHGRALTGWSNLFVQRTRAYYKGPCARAARRWRRAAARTQPSFFGVAPYTPLAGMVGAVGQKGVKITLFANGDAGPTIEDLRLDKTSAKGAVVRSHDLIYHAGFGTLICETNF